MRNLRLLDCQNNFVKMLDEDEARRMIQSKQATLREGGRRAVLVMTSASSVENYVSSGLPAPLSTVYEEHHAGRKIHVLKRPAGDGFERWDNDLTFEELRAGEMISASRRTQMALAERARRNNQVSYERKAA